MRKHNLNYVVVGLFVVAMVVAVVVSAALLAGRTGPRDSYFTVLDNVADVSFGTQVRYDGHPVGQVESITPLAEGGRMRFRVALSIDRGWRIPEDSVARIGNTSFLSAKTIDIESGRAEAAVVADGMIPGGSPGDVFSAMADLAAEFGDLGRDGMLPLLDRMTGVVGQSTELLARLNASAMALQHVMSPDNARALQGVIANTAQTSSDFRAMSRDLANSMERINRLVTNLDTLVASNSQGVDRSLKDAQHTLGSIAQSIDAVTHNLEAASRNLNEFSRLIRQNPGLLLGATAREEASALGGLAERPAE